MRVLVAVCLWAAALLSSGCAIVEQELHNRGGYLDYLADNHWFKADSKKMRALRAYALEASLARLAAVSPKSDQDRKLMAIRVGDATERAQLVLKCAFKENILPVPGTENDPCFFFDSLMVDYTTALFDLAMVALPIEDAKNLLNLIPTGATPDPAAALNALSGLVQLAKDALKYGRLIGAIYRDTLELEVQVWLAAPDQDQTRIPQPYVINPETVAGLRGIYRRGNDDLAQWQAEIGALRDMGLEPIPDPKFIDEIAYLIYYLCGQITSDNATTNNSKSTLALCRSTDSPSSAWVAVWGGTAHSSRVLSAGVQLPAKGTVIGPSGGLGSALRGAIPQGGAHGAINPGPSPSHGIVLANQDVITTGELQSIQQNLCVNQTGKLDQDTKEAVHQAKLGDERSGQLSGKRVFTNTTSDIRSSGEAQIIVDFRDCGLDREGKQLGYATAFEKFAFPGPRAINDLRHLLNMCNGNNKLVDSGLFDGPMRLAIAALKPNSPDPATAQFGYPNSGKPNDPQSGKLNDKWYDYIMNLLQCIPSHR